MCSARACNRIYAGMRTCSHTYYAGASAMAASTGAPTAEDGVDMALEDFIQQGGLGQLEWSACDADWTPFRGPTPEAKLSRHWGATEHAAPRKQQGKKKVLITSAPWRRAKTKSPSVLTTRKQQSKKKIMATPAPWRRAEARSAAGPTRKQQTMKQVRVTLAPWRRPQPPAAEPRHDHEEARRAAGLAVRKQQSKENVAVTHAPWRRPLQPQTKVRPEAREAGLRPRMALTLTPGAGAVFPKFPHRGRYPIGEPPT